MVLPKEVRKKANIKPGDKFALVCIQRGEKVCCISLVKVDELTEIVEDKLGPVMGAMLKKRRSQK
jgi:bifunctional DNA-binding transcriptional regulator/antitoxin component of YhaV-PrlF toxin-antitoxin module